MAARGLLEVSIDRPAEDVFTFLRDYSNEASWQHGHVAAVVVEPPGPALPGTRAHKVRRTKAGQQRFTVEIVELDEASRSWRDVIVSGPFRGSTGSWEVVDNGRACTVRLTMQMRGIGLWKILSPLIQRQANKDLKSELANLKHVLEGPADRK
jgi:ribosome-associated toxin RatA of RatAB toxin-antitoxin module